MIWLALAIAVIFWIIDLYNDAGRNKSRQCTHGVLGDCSKCQEEATERARTLPGDKACLLQGLDEAFFAIDEATRTKIIDVLEDHWVDANLPDWTVEQMKQTVVKVYRQSLTNDGRAMEITGSSIRKRRS